MRRSLALIFAFTVLLAGSAFAQSTDLVSVVTTGTPQEVQAAIESGANINFRQPDTGITPLIAAAKYNQAAIPLLLKARADTSAHDTQYGATVLMWATVYADGPKVITMLLAAGADIKDRDGGGGTALMWAAETNPNPEIVRALLAAGAEVNSRDNNGQTPLIHAAKGNSAGVVGLLMQAGSDPKVKDALGNTALTFAKYNAKLEGTSVLKGLEEASR